MTSTSAWTGKINWDSILRGLVADICVVLFVAVIVNHWLTTERIHTGSFVTGFPVQRYPIEFLSAVFLWGSSAGSLLNSGIVGLMLSHRVLIALSDYSFAIYLWATPVACVLYVYFTHGDGTLETANYFVADMGNNVTQRMASLEVVANQLNSPSMAFVDRVNTYGFSVFLILTHVWGVFYTDMIEANIFGGGLASLFRMRAPRPSKKE